MLRGVVGCDGMGWVWGNPPYQNSCVLVHLILTPFSLYIRDDTLCLSLSATLFTDANMTFRMRFFCRSITWWYDVVCVCALNVQIMAYENLHFTNPQGPKIWVKTIRYLSWSRLGSDFNCNSSTSLWDWLHESRISLSPMFKWATSQQKKTACLQPAS